VVGQKQDSDAPIDLGGDIQGLQQLTQTMAKAVGTRPIAEEVIQQLELHESAEDFLEELSVEQTDATQFIEVSYKHTDPKQATRIVNAVSDGFSEQVSDVAPTTNAITAPVGEQATAPDTPVSPNPIRKGLLALVAEIMLGVGLAFLLNYLDDSWQSSEEVEQLSGVSPFGFIPGLEESKVKKGDA
jgi:capsular polysaccharide biosynthesis protein